MYCYKIVEGNSISAAIQLLEKQISNGWSIVSFQPVLKPSLDGPQLCVVFLLEKEERRQKRAIGFMAQP